MLNYMINFNPSSFSFKKYFFKDNLANLLVLNVRVRGLDGGVAKL